ncbi:S-adenosyl-L-methionine-dependent methyltransferase [Irpex rosettiformis]|uniref:S-adenosyl-L-methionine-dependent methyltransferase n=1 Tax=Irpex rosettiformis TaxID=378272 RepID=A0ACB8UER7_9APHY|nr:S-adenosyl-L-methionine-dependent methyltransferase [Irpex rosettiformis]
MSTETQSQPTPQEQVRKFIAEDHKGGWDEAWKASFTPWDVGEVQPAFHDLLKSSEIDFPKSGRALVPGCGRAYDAIFIANELGLDTLAVDISATAVKAAEELLASPKGATSSGRVSVKQQDFFAFEVPEAERFDLIYDYTFFVAILPSMRKDWGRKINSLIKPGGYLALLVFPIDPPQDYGPPFFVRPEHYDEVLGDGWTKVLDKIPERSSPVHVNRERVVVYKRNM